MDRLKRAWYTWCSLSWTRRRVFVQAWLLLPLTMGALRLFGYRRTQVAVLRGDRASRRVDLPTAQDTAHLVQYAAAWSMIPASCLARSLVLGRLLRSQGLAAELRIGVARPAGRFTAHAWVEHGGVALAETEGVGTRYVVFDEPLLTEGR